MAAAATRPMSSPGAVPEPLKPDKMAEQVQIEWVQNLNSHLICNECKEDPPNIVEEYSSGDMVCGSCGLVLGDRIIDTGSEWRTFSNDDQGNDDPSRVGDGPNELLNGSQLQTSISFGDGSSRVNRELHRAQNKSTHDKSTKALLAAYKEIGAYCDSKDLSRSVSESAKYIYKLSMDANILRGKSQDSIIASCIFLGCRQCGVGRSFKEIHEMTKTPKKEIGRVFKILKVYFEKHNEELKLKQHNGNVPEEAQREGSKFTTIEAQDIIIRFCSRLGLSPRATMVCQSLAAKISDDGGLAGRSQLSVSGGCIYFASHLMRQGKSPKEVGAVVSVSEGTVRTSYKVLYEKRDMLIDSDWLKDGKGDVSLLPKA